MTLPCLDIPLTCTNEEYAINHLSFLALSVEVEEFLALAFVVPVLVKTCRKQLELSLKLYQ